jgi:hypothetical protein
MIARCRIIAVTVVSAAITIAEASFVSAGFLIAPENSDAAISGSAPTAENKSQVCANLCTDLKAGWQLNTGESLFSALGGFRLTMQSDGNLVLYAIDDMKLPIDILHVMSGSPDVLKLYAKPVWSTGTHVPKEGRSPGRSCSMEENGNFVVYDDERRPVFETGTGGHPGAFLRLQSDGNLVVYTSDLKRAWASNTAARLTLARESKQQRAARARPVLRQIRGRPAQFTMDLRSRWRLNRGDSVYSPLGGFRLMLQDDGNLVLYVIDDEQIPADITPLLLHTEDLAQLYHNALWSTRTHTFSQKAGPGAYCVMEEDGNFVIYDDDDNPRFQTRTKGNPGAFLRCQDDGNLVIYTRDKKAIWQSMTYARIVDDPTPERP